MIPYYAWNNRGEDSMIIWIPRTKGLAAEGMISNLLTETDLGKVLASHTHQDATVAAVVDGKLPKNSADRTHRRWISLPFKNRRQDISFTFPATRKVRSVSVYWCEGPEQEIRLPRNWRIDYKTGDGDWTRMKKYVTDFYGLEPDKFNFIKPGVTLSCDAIRISMLPTVGYCIGIHEIQFEFEE